MTNFTYSRVYFIFSCFLALCSTNVQAGVIIRLATEADIPACVKLATQVARDVYKPITQKVSKVKKSIFRQGMLFVAEDDESRTVVGCMLVNNFFTVDYSDKENRAKFIAFVKKPITPGIDVSSIFLSKVYVDAACRGKGIGKKMMLSLTTFFPDVKKIYLNTYAANAQAIRFYSGLGFKELFRVNEGKPREWIALGIDAEALQ